MTAVTSAELWRALDETRDPDILPVLHDLLIEEGAGGDGHWLVSALRHCVYTQPGLLPKFVTRDVYHWIDSGLHKNLEELALSSTCFAYADAKVGKKAGYTSHCSPTHEHAMWRLAWAVREEARAYQIEKE